ncbi:diguanylate cyclase domain-containing protein [Demequina sp. SO4-13]|uniref:diguanylate cyclase domain-containing protein n=1 Tax=Demequina sp. SO4-13 TaxID=3401027 RepID=UPI003AF966AF
MASTLPGRWVIANSSRKRPGSHRDDGAPSVVASELQSELDERLGWRQVVAALPQIVWITRPDGYHLFFNQQWLDFTGLTLAESLGDGWLPPFHPDDRARTSRRWKESISTGEPYEIEYRLRRHDGVYRWMLGRAVPLRDESGDIVEWFGTCTDIHVLKEALDEAAGLREELEFRATHDFLTRLANRELLFEQLGLMLRQRRSTGLVVVFMDLDWFKVINDRLGHSAGDQLLVHVADRLRATVRQSDVAARIGGDEFVVVGEAKDEEDAERFAARVAEGIRGHVTIAGERVEVAASIGTAYVEAGDTRSADAVLALADARMYEVKRRR